MGSFPGLCINDTLPFLHERGKYPSARQQVNSFGRTSGWCRLSALTVRVQTKSGPGALWFFSFLMYSVTSPSVISGNGAGVPVCWVRSGGLVAAGNFSYSSSALLSSLEVHCAPVQLCKRGIGFFGRYFAILYGVPHGFDCVQSSLNLACLRSTMMFLYSLLITRCIIRSISRVVSD